MHLPSLIRVFYYLYGTLTLVGGFVGYFTASSLNSLLVGTLSGIILLMAAYLRPITPARTDVALLLTSGGLLWFFIPRYLESAKFMPAGLMAILSSVALVLAFIELVSRLSHSSNAES